MTPASPVYRGALIPLLLRERPWQLPELAAHLGITLSQLRRDLAQVRAAGWRIDEETADLGRGAGRPKILKIAR